MQHHLLPILSQGQTRGAKCLFFTYVNGRPHEEQGSESQLCPLLECKPLAGGILGTYFDLPFIDLFHHPSQVCICNLYGTKGNKLPPSALRLVQPSVFHQFCQGAPGISELLSSRNSSLCHLLAGKLQTLYWNNSGPFIQCPTPVRKLKYIRL